MVAGSHTIFAKGRDTSDIIYTKPSGRIIQGSFSSRVVDSVFCWSHLWLTAKDAQHHDKMPSWIRLSGMNLVPSKGTPISLVLFKQHLERVNVTPLDLRAIQIDFSTNLRLGLELRKHPLVKNWLEENFVPGARYGSERPALKAQGLNPTGALPDRIIAAAIKDTSIGRSIATWATQGGLRVTTWEVAGTKSPPIPRLLEDLGLEPNPKAVDLKELSRKNPTLAALLTDDGLKTESPAHNGILPLDTPLPLGFSIRAHVAPAAGNGNKSR